MSYSETQLAYWNERACLGERAGTDDWIAEELERRAIEKYVRDGMRILEVGCGAGGLALRLAEKYDIAINAYDLSPEMIAMALYNGRQKPRRGSIIFEVGDVCSLGDEHHYDLAITERCIINLGTWAKQRDAICKLFARAERYLMVENSQDGLDRVNGLRGLIGLTAITPPWHNRYLREAELAILAEDIDSRLCCQDITGTYAFLSRVLNAKLAAAEGREPNYQDKLNKLALELPTSLINGLGQTKLWIWSRR